MKVYSMVIALVTIVVTPCMVIINNFSNKIIIGKFVQVFPNKSIHLNLAILGYVVRTAHLNNSLVQLN